MTEEPGTTATSSSGRPVEPEPGAVTGGTKSRAGRQRSAAEGEKRPSAQKGTSATKGDARSAPTRPTPAAESAQVMLAPGAGVFAVIAIAWLAAMLWSGQRSITSANVDSIAIAITALSLPGVISASLISGAAMGLTVTNLLAGRGIVRAAPRFTAAVIAGLVTGVLAAVAVALSYGGDPANMVLAGAIAAAATIGGAAAGLRTAPAIGGVVAAGLVVFAVSYLLTTFQDPLLSLYGSGETEESKVNALEWFSRTSWLVGGLAAGLVAFAYLRWDRRRTAARGVEQPSLRWPWYLVAGAGPGLLLVATEILTRTAGGRVLDLTRELSEADDTFQGWLGTSRFDYALGVLFLGAFTALLAFGRTLRPPTDPADEPPTQPPAGPRGRTTGRPADDAKPAGWTEPDDTDENGADTADDETIGVAAGRSASADDKAGAAGW